MGRVTYQHIKFFKDFFEQKKKNGADFELIRSTYTRVIKFKNTTIVFNASGVNDNDLLSLIGSVRREGKAFMGSPEFNKQGEFIKFFDLFEKPKLNGVVSKVDIKSAYWSYSLHKGVITEDTNTKLLTLYDGKPIQELKDARVKALGSLASSRRHEIYIKGKLFHDYEVPDHPDNPWVDTQPTKDVYIEICRGIDDMMRDCMVNVEGCIYYYWDCMFVPIEIEKKVIEFFRDHKYTTSVGHTKLDYYTIGDKGWLISEVDEKQYMVRKENSYILKEQGLM